MESQAYAPPTPEWTISLSDDELSYVLAVHGKCDTIPGLDSNSFLQEIVAPKEYASKILQRSLMAKGCAILDSDGNWVLEKTFEDILALIIKPVYMLEIASASIGSLIVSRVNGFFAPNVLILQSFPRRNAHRFEVFFHSIDWVSFLRGFLPERSLSSISQNFSIPKRLVYSQLSSVASEQSATLTATAVSEDATVIWQMLPEQDLFLRLTVFALASLDLTGERLFVSGGEAGYIVIHDPAIFDQSGSVNIELAGSQRVGEILAKLLEQITLK